MNEKLEVKIKPKVFKNIVLGIVGLLIIYIGILYLVNNWWWTIAILIGIFVVYSSINVLFFPRSIILVIDDQYLFITDAKTKQINLNQINIQKGLHYTNKYELLKIENIWRFKVKVNFSTSYEVIYAIYDSKKINLLDISGDYKLKYNDFENILKFIMSRTSNT